MNSRKKYVLFLAITILLPFLVAGMVEVGLRLARPDGGLPLFVKARAVSGDYLVANARVGARWFASIENPPSPAPEMFAGQKPARAFRIFVLGESAAAGFPYPRNVTFSRFLEDVLRDVLPGDSVEVVNLGIAATNSFAMLDMAKEVSDQHPDAVLIYAGHNEYYGALGAASRVSVPGGAGAVRLYLRLLHLRLVLALRNTIAALRNHSSPPNDNLQAASLMEVLARDRQIPLSSARYEEGVRQFETNLEAVAALLEHKGIPVLIGSLASNLRDQPPFAADANSAPGSADSVYQSGRAAFARSDTILARASSLAREIWTSSAFALPVNSTRSSGVSALARVPFMFQSPRLLPLRPRAACQARISSSSMCIRRAVGQALIGRVFFESLIRAGVLGTAADTTRLHSWDEYLRGTDLTPFDERIALHVTQTLKSRWPFVPVAQQVDYRGQYTPVSLLDSLALQFRAEPAGKLPNSGSAKTTSAENSSILQPPSSPASRVTHLSRMSRGF